MYKLVQHLAHIWSKTWSDVGKLLDLIFTNRWTDFEPDFNQTSGKMLDQILTKKWSEFGPDVRPKVGQIFDQSVYNGWLDFARFVFEIDWNWGPNFTNCVIRFWIILVPDVPNLMGICWYHSDVMMVYGDYIMIMIYNVIW